ncbi:heme biosynthesis HemY N-terminal domain-containing protein [Salinibius halmophilus]|uniref:heme biosynthesis HemY N-terminal domain-containing protein n=1 Tax=Salinibius halmophilus TaxID=1853216 RepID=UPI000E66A718|nr:heme biosynthesis HemY N-terminal domain-containing protein [Salinibius halmophilus]
MKLTTLIWLAIALVIMGFVGQLVAADAGYVLLQYGQWRIETSIWLLLIALVLFYVVVRFAVWLFTRGVWLKQFGDWRSRRSQLQAENHLQNAVLHYLDEKYAAAEKLFGKATQKQGAWLAWLMSARSAWAQDNLNTALHFLDQGKTESPKLKLLFDLQRIEFLREQGKLEQALAVVKNLAEQYPKNGYVTKQWLAISIALKDGTGVVESLPRLLNNHLPGRRSESQRMVKMLTDQVPEWLHNCLDERQQKSLMQLWYQLDKTTRAKPELACALARILAAQGANKQAIAIIRHALKQSVNDELLVLYSEVIDNAEQQLQDLEVLVKTEPNQAAALFSAGRLCLHLQLWGRAKDYLTRSLSHKDTQSVRIALLALANATKDIALQQQQQEALLAPKLKALGFNS